MLSSSSASSFIRAHFSMAMESGHRAELRQVPAKLVLCTVQTLESKENWDIWISGNSNICDSDCSGLTQDRINITYGVLSKNSILVEIAPFLHLESLGSQNSLGKSSRSRRHCCISETQRTTASIAHAVSSAGFLMLAGRVVAHRFSEVVEKNHGKAKILENSI